MQLLDQIPSYDTHKIAVLYVGEGQVRLPGWQGPACMLGRAGRPPHRGGGVWALILCRAWSLQGRWSVGCPLSSVPGIQE